MPYLSTDEYAIPFLLAGESVGLKALEDGSWPKELFPTWSTSDLRLATIEPRDGRFFLRGQAPGPVTLTAHFPGGQTAEKPFTILDPERPQWVRFELLQEGHSAGRCRFGVEAGYAPKFFRPMTAHPTLAWTTSDSALARWEAPGLLELLGDGDVTVAVAGMGVEKSIALHLHGGVAFRLDSLFSRDKVMARGIRYYAAVSVHRTDEKFYQARAPGLTVEVVPAIVSFEQTGKTQTMTARELGRARVTAQLGAQRLEAEVEVIDGDVSLEPIRVNGDTYSVGGSLQTFIGKELELSTQLRSSKGSLTGELNLEWTSSAPEVLELDEHLGIPVAKAVGAGRATLRAASKARGLLSECTIEVSEPPEIQWF